MKKLAVIFASALVLTGCATEPSGPSSYADVAPELELNCESYEAGAGAALISVSGEFGSTPEVSFPAPIAGEGVETLVVSEGDGGQIVGGQRVALHFAAYNAGTGEAFQASNFGSEEFIFQDLIAGGTPDFCKALTGVQVGSRVAVLLSPESAHNAVGIESLGIAPDDGVIFIFDVIDAYLPRAIGESRNPVNGMPSVILAPAGQPGIQIPSADAPTEFQRNVLIEGSGEEIAIDDQVVVHYTGWTWEGEQFDSSWDRQSPAVFTVSNSSLIEGFVQALEGVKVGSQVIAVIPPELGYGDSAQGSIPAGSTLIFVVDVLGKG